MQTPQDDGNHDKGKVATDWSTVEGVISEQSLINNTAAPLLIKDA